MSHSLLRVALILEACLSLPAFAGPTSKVAALRQEIKSIQQDFVAFQIDLSPEFAFELGLKSQQTISDYSPENWARLRDQLQNISDRIKILEPRKIQLSPPERIEFDVLRHAIYGSIYKFNNRVSADDFVLIPFEYLIHSRTDFAGGPGTEEEWAAIGQYLSALPRFYIGAEEHVRATSDEKLPHRLVIEEAIKQADIAAEYYRRGLPALAEDSLGAENPGVDKIHASGDRAADAVLAFRDFLAFNVLPKASNSVALGPNKVREAMFWTEHLQPKEISALLRESDKEAKQFRDQLLSEHNSDDTVEAVEYPVDDNTALSKYQAVADGMNHFVRKNGILNLPKGYLPRVNRTEARASGGSRAMYIPSPLDSEERGGIRFAPTRDRREQSALQIPTRIKLTGTHETAHSMQDTITKAARDKFPAYYWTIFSGHFAEGWAEYMTELLSEKGYYSNSELHQLWLREYGGHSSSTLDLALALGKISSEKLEAVLRNSGESEADIRGELYRYLKLPLQSLGYSVGKIEIKQLKEEYKKLKGGAYSENGFHRKLLSYGPIPIPFIRQFMLLDSKNAPPSNSEKQNPLYFRRLRSSSPPIRQHPDASDPSPAPVKETILRTSKHLEHPTEIMIK